MSTNLSESDMSQLVKIIRDRASYDFENYSDKSLERRFLKIMMDYRLTVSKMIERLRIDSNFVEDVVKRITVNTTEMFRDPQVWSEINSGFLQKLAQKDSLLIWHAGCSSGLEVYSMVILLSELGMLSKTKIYATDLNSDVLENARRGIYRLRFNLNYLDNYCQVLRSLPKNIGVSNNELLHRYLEIDSTSDQIRIIAPFTDIPVFAKHDLVTGSAPCPFEQPFDLIVCRNVVIYFNYELQNRIFSLFHECMSNDGILWMGIHESIHGLGLAKFAKKTFYYKKL